MKTDGKWKCSLQNFIQLFNFLQKRKPNKKFQCPNDIFFTNLFLLLQILFFSVCENEKEMKIENISNQKWRNLQNKYVHFDQFLFQIVLWFKSKNCRKECRKFLIMNYCKSPVLNEMCTSFYKNLNLMIKSVMGLNTWGKAAPRLPKWLFHRTQNCCEIPVIFCRTKIWLHTQNVFFW